MKEFKTGLYTSIINWEWNNPHYVLSHPKLVEKHLLPSKEKRLLELGCGYGRETQILGNSFKEVVGLDGGGKTIKLARQLAIEQKKDNVNFYVYPTDLHELKPESFDCLYSYTVVQHCANNIAEILLLDGVLMLKKGGRFLLEFMNKHNVIEGARYNPLEYCDVPRTDEEAVKLLEGVGLVVETIEHRYYAGKAGGMQGWYAGVKK